MNIKGNAKVRNELEKTIQSGNISHSYLFLGIDGIGKKEIAKEFSKKLLCNNKEKNCQCKSCICFETQNHPDFKIINEEDETIKINTIRELVSTVYEKPIMSKNKIYIINSADKMTKEAQNSLLKTLEEPPEYTIIILIASNTDMLLNTIKSRCTKITFEKLTPSEILEILKEQSKEIPDISEKMFDFFDGSIAKALKILEKKEIYDSIDSSIENIRNMKKIDFLTKNKEIFIKEEIYEILEYYMVSLFYIAKKTNNIKYINCVKYIQETINHLKANSNYDMSIDYMLFKIWEEVHENNSRS